MEVKHKSSGTSLSIGEAVWFRCDRMAYDGNRDREVITMLGRLLTRLHDDSVIGEWEVLDVLGEGFEGV